MANFEKYIEKKHYYAKVCFCIIIVIKFNQSTQCMIVCSACTAGTGPAVDGTAVDGTAVDGTAVVVPVSVVPTTNNFERLARILVYYRIMEDF